jgi:hypothetical protein
VCVRPGVVSCVVELRGAATDLLHPVVREGLATLRGASIFTRRAGRRLGAARDWHRLFFGKPLGVPRRNLSTI